MSDASKRKAKQKWAIEKPKLDKARRLRGIFFIQPDDDEFKRGMKNAHRKFEIPMPAAMPCRLQLHQHRETCGTVGQHKTKYACIVEADESMIIRMEGSQRWVLGAFGSPCRKRTLFLIGNVDNLDLHRIARKCVGTGGRCSVSAPKHVHPKPDASRSE